MLDSFADNLPKGYLLECDSNGVTQIKNICIKRESNQIGGKLNQIESKTVGQIKSDTASQIQSEKVSQIKSAMESRIQL